jgi:hypothetical protein
VHGLKECRNAQQMLELVRADCEQLLASASSTAELATRISGKVRALNPRLLSDCTPTSGAQQTSLKPGAESLELQ